MKTIGQLTEKLLIGNQYFQKNYLKGHCVKVKCQIWPVIELSLRIMPVNNILKFESDWSTTREVIRRKPIFSEKWHKRSLCQGQRSLVIELSLRIITINNILKFESDWSTNREVIDRKPIFSEKLHKRSLCQLIDWSI